LETLQVNLGYKCNQTCLHCHVNAGPNRTEMMDDATIALIPQVLEARQIGTLDLTGGAPELHERFRDIVRTARAQGVRVIDRCNLTILFEPGQEGLAQFLADHRVEVVASMPCYSAANVDKQRGDGVFDKSIAGLQQLNELGYGQPGSGLILNLVYNPQGASLPPEQKALEADYKRELAQHFGIVFNQLLALTNMPIQRFGSTLVSKGTFQTYMDLLKGSYQAHNLAGVMCRSMVSVDYQGWLSDCDFNQQLGLPLGTTGVQRHLRDLLKTGLDGQAIRVAGHCFGCTAGQGSSCGGALETHGSSPCDQSIERASLDLRQVPRLGTAGYVRVLLPNCWGIAQSPASSCGHAHNLGHEKHDPLRGHPRQHGSCRVLSAVNGLSPGTNHGCARHGARNGGPSSLSSHAPAHLCAAARRCATEPVPVRRQGGARGQHRQQMRFYQPIRRSGGPVCQVPSAWAGGAGISV